MKLEQEYFIQEVTYRYEDKTEKEAHKNHMVDAGFIIMHGFNTPLTVTYQHRQLSDRS